MRPWQTIPLLGVAVVCSALGVVYAEHLSRRTFAELQALREQRDELNVDWGRLMLEQSTWATHGRIEKLARERLGMVIPSPDSVVIVEP